MSIDVISGFSYPLNQSSGTNLVTSTGNDSDGDGDGSRASGNANRSGGKGAFIDAVFQALSQSGVSGNNAQLATSSNSSSTTQDPVQALGSFMHNLFAALQSQGPQGSAQNTQSAASQGTDSDGNNNASNTSTAQAVSGQGHHHHHHGGGAGNIESKLQSLIQQLSSNSTTSDSTQPALNQSFQNLQSSLGSSGGQATLGSFLQTLSQNIQGVSATGNAVNTTA